MKQTILAILVLLLCAPAYGQERMESSDGWRVEGGWLQGPELGSPIVRNDTMFLSLSFDTSRVFIERLDTTKADTCRECPAGYELVHFNDGDACLRRRVEESGYMIWRGSDIVEVSNDTVFDYSPMVPVVHPTAIDTTWRLIPEGFTKSEWLKLWAVMHPAHGSYRLMDIVDTMMSTIPAYIIDDSCLRRRDTVYNEDLIGNTIITDRR